MSPPADVQQIARAMRGECLAMRVRQLNRRVTRVYDAALRPLGVSTAQLNVLVALALMSEARATDVATALGLEKSTLSRNLERMMARGWVAGGAGGGGAQPLRLLPAGRRLLADALPAWRAAQRRVAAELPPELVDALRRGGPGPAATP
ncbi:MAG TPA: MarR family winged helix-turn-helix transcriptional regulator [Gemmatimonadaceae bacterium]|nr:MarR family winged helix-turn-helix transcriptional regulator [Gemmatimonadaceae bacterium]